MTDINVEKMNEWKKCKCGKHLLKGDNLIDTVYPCTREKDVLNAYCNVTMGGCGRTVYADTIENLLIRWNNGVTDVMEADERSYSIESIRAAIKTFQVSSQYSVVPYCLPLQIRFDENAPSLKKGDILVISGRP